MFLGLAWYLWIVFIIVLAISIPLKIKFMKWWNKRLKDNQSSQRDKWGDEQ